MKKIIPLAAIAALFLSACNNKSDTGAKTTDSAVMVLANNKATAMNTETAFNKHDIDAVLKDCSSDYAELGDGTSKPQKNMDSIKMGLKSFLAAFPDLKGENLHAVAEGDSVLVTGTWSGTFKGEFMKMKPTGKSYKAPDVDIFTFNKAGKITSHSSVQSQVTFMYQLGVPLPEKKK